MLDYLKYLTECFGVPMMVIGTIVVVIVIMNLVGELLEFKGKMVPECMKVRKYFTRKKKERETLKKMPEMINEIKIEFADFNSHYSNDNIAARNDWINTVNSKLENNEEAVREIKSKLDTQSEAIVALLVDNKRETIISFAEKVSDDDFPATREQFTRIDRIYQEYERIISERGLKNGEVDVAYKIIEEAYQSRLKSHTFIEDVRWHGLEKQ